MHVESVEGEGSVFSFTLPIHSAQVFVRRVRDAAAGAPRLLLVEDDEHYIDILVASLSPKYDLTVTNSVERAKELLREETYYYLVLDFFLVDGISSEIVRFLDETGIDTPVVIISAEDDTRIVGNIMYSDQIEGVFNKSDIERICTLLGNLTEGAGIK
jgi:DNA-binding NtrC family response regulator